MDRSKSLQKGKSLVIGQDGNRNKIQELESEREGFESLDGPTGDTATSEAALAELDRNAGLPPLNALLRARPAGPSR